MDKFKQYIDSSSDLEKDSRYILQIREKEDENEIRTIRQNTRIYILFGVVIFIL